ncbi:MAG: protein kinase [bacterium]|nr:protein kinase [bacterium]
METGSNPPQNNTEAKLKVGDVIGDRYRIEAELGQGGMARVYKVLDLELEEEIALKLLTSGLAWKPEAVEQFKQEIRLARRIVHQNVCRIYDFNRWEGMPFVTMELIIGDTLAERLAAGSIGGLGERLTIFRDVLAGLRVAHSLGIVHLDIKPENIVITADNRPVVMDFGIAHEIDPEGGGGGLERFGTPSYSAPELFMGEDTDHRSDIYSLGILLFELAAHRQPFVGSPEGVIQAHVSQPAPRVQSFNPDVPLPIDRAVDRMLAKEPGQRYSSVDEVLAELAEIRLSSIGRTVLFAMGDRHLQALMAHHMKAVGLVPRCTNDGEQAIELLLKERPDLVLVDTEVSKIDGLRIIEMLRHFPHASDLPVVMLSATRNPAYAAYANQLEVKQLISRPVESRALARQLRDMMKAS